MDEKTVIDYVIFPVGAIFTPLMDNAWLTAIREWNRKHEIAKRISSRVDVFANLPKVDLICYGQVPIIIIAN